MYIKFVYIAITDHCIRTNETKFSYKKKKKIRKEKFSYQILPRSQKKKKENLGIEASFYSIPISRLIPKI